MSQQAPMLRPHKKRSRRARWAWIAGGAAVVIIGLAALAVWWFLHVNSGAALSDLQPQAVIASLTNGQSLKVQEDDSRWNCKWNAQGAQELSPGSWREVSLPNALSQAGDLQVEFRSGSTKGSLALLKEQQIVVVHIGRYYRCYQLPEEAFEVFVSRLRDCR